MQTVVMDDLRPGEAAETGWDRKKRATRAALRRAAVRLVEARGLAQVTVEDIAAAAGVSPRTFFNYFPTKEDAVVGWDPGLLAELVAHLRARPVTESPLQALGATLLEVFAPADVDVDDRLRRLRVARSDPHLMAHQVLRFGDTERELVAALADRRGTEPAHDHYAALVVAAVLAAGRAALMAWCDDGGRRSLDRVLADHLRVLGEGLAEPERNTR
jgi:AcrR family transcriptional regulator